MRIVIVGSGITGKLCALSLRKAGHEVAVFEKNARYSEAATSFVAAGLLTPLAEAANGDPDVAILGKLGLCLWQDLAAKVNNKDLIDLNGSVSLAFNSDLNEFRDFERKLAAKNISFESSSNAPIEEDLNQDHLTYHVIKGEGKVDTKAFMKVLQEELEALQVECSFSQTVSEIGPGWIRTNGMKVDSDIVVDCRGISAQQDLHDLRGVRGEVIILHAPEVQINRPVRVLHPRHPVYIVPRKNHEYVIGATSIESEYAGPISVKSALDLLNGIYNIHHGFRYADIVKTAAGLRPAYTNNLPRLDVSNRLIRINGLFRHGYLLGPLFAQAISDVVNRKPIRPDLKPFVRDSL